MTSKIAVASGRCSSGDVSYYVVMAKCRQTNTRATDPPYFPVNVYALLCGTDGCLLAGLGGHVTEGHALRELEVRDEDEKVAMDFTRSTLPVSKESSRT